MKRLLQLLLFTKCFVVVIATGNNNQILKTNALLDAFHKFPKNFFFNLRYLTMRVLRR